MRIVWHGPLTHPGSVRLTCPPVAAMDAHASTSTHAMSHYEGINALPAYAPLREHGSPGVAGCTPPFIHVCPLRPQTGGPAGPAVTAPPSAPPYDCVGASRRPAVNLMRRHRNGAAEALQPAPVSPLHQPPPPPPPPPSPPALSFRQPTGSLGHPDPPPPQVALGHPGAPVLGT